MNCAIRGDVRFTTAILPEISGKGLKLPDNRSDSSRKLPEIAGTFSGKSLIFIYIL